MVARTEYMKYKSTLSELSWMRIVRSHHMGSSLLQASCTYNLTVSMAGDLVACLVFRPTTIATRESRTVIEALFQNCSMAIVYIIRTEAIQTGHIDMSFV